MGSQTAQAQTPTETQNNHTTSATTSTTTNIDHPNLHPPNVSPKGAQTVKVQAQVQAQPTTETPNNQNTTTTTSTTSEPTNPPPQNPSPPATKLPFRPKKIRKLSPTTTTTTATKPQNSTALIPLTVARLLSCPGELETALNHLKSADPLLTPLINHHPPPTLDTCQQSPFLALTKSILYQQLAYKAGTSIYTRFISLCGGEPNVLPEVVLALTPPQLRQIGVSARKSSYLHDLARKYQNGILSDKLILEMDDKSLFTMLTMVNGIGSWSVHMFMIFSLHRPDVLPVHDLGIRKGVQMLLGLDELPRPSQMDHLCEKWRPYRSVAAWYIWRFVEAKGPNSYAGVGESNAGGAFSLEQQQQQQYQQHQQFLDRIHGTQHLGSYAGQ